MTPEQEVTNEFARKRFGEPPYLDSSAMIVEIVRLRRENAAYEKAEQENIEALDVVIATLKQTNEMLKDAIK